MAVVIQLFITAWVRIASQAHTKIKMNTQLIVLLDSTSRLLDLSTVCIIATNANEVAIFKARVADLVVRPHGFAGLPSIDSNGLLFG